MKMAIIKAVIWSISLLPTWFLRMMAVSLGWLTWVMSGTKRNSTIKNLAACYPALSEEERMVLGRKSMRHYILTVLETGLNWFGSRKRILGLFDEPCGLEHLQAASAHGKGVMILLPHFGNWELTGPWFTQQHEVMALYKPSAHEGFDREMMLRREKFGTRMAPTSRGGLKQIYRHLAEAGLVLVLPDQEPSSGEGRFAPFFGVPALTPVLAPRLIQRTGCRAVFAVCRRTGKGRFQMVFVPAPESLDSTDLDTALKGLNEGVEACVEIDTVQYLWAYKRFKTRPDGEPPFYRKPA